MEYDSRAKTKIDRMAERIKQLEAAARSVIRAYDHDKPHLPWSVGRLKQCFGMGEYEKSGFDGGPPTQESNDD